VTNYNTADNSTPADSGWKMAILTYPTHIWCPPLGWSYWNFVKIFRMRRL